MDTDEMSTEWRKFKANQPIHPYNLPIKMCHSPQKKFKQKMAAKMLNCAVQQTRTRHPAVSEPQNACNVHCWSLKGERKWCWLQQILNTLETSANTVYNANITNFQIPSARYIHFNLVFSSDENWCNNNKQMGTLKPTLQKQKRTSFTFT
jgi:hypothetical protein